MNPTLLLHDLRRILPMWTALTAVTAAYIAVVVAMYDPRADEGLDALIATMPELFAAFGMDGASATLSGFMVDYLYGFLLVLLPMVMVVAAVHGTLIRPIETGSMAYLLASPHSRRTIVGSALASVVASSAAMAVAVSVTEAVCVAVRAPGDVALSDIAAMNLGLLALWLSMAGVCALSACAIGNASAALWTGAGLCAAQFLIRMLAQADDGMDVLRYATALTLLDPEGLAAGEGPAVCGAVALAVAGAAMCVAAVEVFRRRDLSL